MLSRPRRALEQRRGESAQAALDRMQEGERLDGRRTRRRVASPEQAHPADDGAWGTRGSTSSDDQRPLFEFMPVTTPVLPAKEDPPPWFRLVSPASLGEP